MTTAQDLFRKVRKQTIYFGTMAIGQTHIGNQPTSAPLRLTKIMPLFRRFLLTSDPRLQNINTLFVCNHYNLRENLRRTSTMEVLKE
jgi:hypothetical protein